MTHEPYIHKEAGESSLRCDCGNWQGEHLADMEGHRAHRRAVDALGLLDETTAEVERLQSEVDRRERQIGIHLRMVHEAGKEADRLRAENTAQAERIAAVIELHRPVNHRGMQVCNACTSLDVLMQTMSGRGRRGVEHPCPTRRALGLDQNGEGQANG